MKFSNEVLKEASAAGSKKIADAFSVLSGAQVSVTVSKSEAVPLKESLQSLTKPQEHAVVVYAQLLSGMPGVSVLILSRESALTLVDLLNRQPPGTTGVMKDIDRSAIKETLNILSNSYMTALSESTKMTMGLGVPGMIPSSRFESIVADLVSRDADSDDSAVLFETTLTITEHKIEAQFSLLFNERLTELISKDL